MLFSTARVVLLFQETARVLHRSLLQNIFQKQGPILIHAAVHHPSYIWLSFVSYKINLWSSIRLYLEIPGLVIKSNFISHFFSTYKCTLINFFKEFSGIVLARPGASKANVLKLAEFRANWGGGVVFFCFGSLRIRFTYNWNLWMFC